MICVSFAPQNMRSAYALLDKSSRLSNLIEIRIENIVDLNLSKLIKYSDAKTIITSRPMKGIPENKRIQQLFDAIDSGAAFVDVEIESGEKTIGLLRSRIKSLGSKTKLIVSYHNYEKTPKNLVAIYKRLKKTEADLIKIAVFASDITDNVTIFKLLERARQERIKLSAFCIGEKGEISRVLASRFGGMFTYCSLEAGKETAAGQVHVEKLQDVFNFNLINKKTKIFGLVGNPVFQSKGIFVHNNFFKKKKYNAVYVNFLTDDFSKFIKVFKNYISGLSITIPYKTDALRSLDWQSPDVSATKAVNTIIRNNGKLYGYNTDVLALKELLKDKMKSKTAFVVGTGGAARSAIVAVLQNGGEVIVGGRDIKKVKKLGLEFDCRYFPIHRLGPIEFDVLINATPIGMVPNTNASPVSPKILKPGMLVIDFVYNPLKTKLLKDANKKGCRVISGLEIYKLQAKMQQTLFLTAR
jgi:3-dehydroquinate dehydratase / shikimate dehydrogenase